MTVLQRRAVAVHELAFLFLAELRLGRKHEDVCALRGVNGLNIRVNFVASAGEVDAVLAFVIPNVHVRMLVNSDECGMHEKLLDFPSEVVHHRLLEL